MKKYRGCYIFIAIIFSTLALLTCSVCLYGDETQKSNEGKKQQPPPVSIERDKDAGSSSNVVKEDPKSSIKREVAKKKVPAFWFLLPEK